MEVLVPIIIVIIIGFQGFFFVKNLKRMKLFSKIFEGKTSWKLTRVFNTDDHTDFVNGIGGNGNNIFVGIRDSINTYLKNNTGSVIDFGLLKDAVDRHCDAVEEEIGTQTPIPLYLGLVGTMAGVILGLFDLLDSDAIMTLMGSGAGKIDQSATNAAKGVDGLLSGVAWAMGASIVGILLTTISSLLFKRYKLQEEAGKNEFLAWMQSKLLPELPTDTADAMKNMVVNLNHFNSSFSKNTSELRQAFKAVNESYAIQGKIIQHIHDMDVVKMANANVRVLRELESCTERLQEFNIYLNSIKGYTEQIHTFEEMFRKEANRLKVLEEIRDYFKNFNASIGKTVADADRYLQSSLTTIKDNTATNVNEMHRCFTEQSTHFKKMIQQEQEAFEAFMKRINAEFEKSMNQAPKMQKQLEEISKIPGHLDKLLDKVDASNRTLANEVSKALKSSSKQTVLSDGNGNTVVAPSMPSWMKYVAFAAVIIIAVGCVFNMVTYFIPHQHPAYSIESVDSLVVDPSVVDSVATDTTAVVDTATVRTSTQHVTSVHSATTQPTSQNPDGH